MKEQTLKTQNEVTWTLICSVFSSVLGSVQVGFHTGNINSPQMIIEAFFNVTWMLRYGERMSPHMLTLLWSLTVSILALGATISSFFVAMLANHFGGEFGECPGYRQVVALHADHVHCAGHPADADAPLLS
ncbi:hypothetical protein FKM82_014417 [Ascaphus truei]